jgi:hypothetical protein
VHRSKRWVALQMVYGAVIDEIDELFVAHGYKYMPIKGAYLIRSGLSIQIPERRMRDIDLLLPEKEFNDACDWFGRREGVTETPNYWNFERSFNVTHAGILVYVELHRMLNMPARFLLPTGKLFSHGKFAGKSCTLPDPVDALLIHICHAIAHVLDGFTPGFYQEIDLLSRQDGFLWELFWQRSKTTGIYDFIWLTVDKCNKLLGKSLPIPRASSIYAKMLSRCNLFMKCKSKILRRLCFEIPFVRNPWALLWHKVYKGIKKGRILI